MKLLIKNGTVVDYKNNLNKVIDILIEGGKIIEISENIKVNDVEVIDAKGKYVLPGFVDAHCHLRDPGLEYKEDIRSGTRSAAKGGFTSIACMPNTNPIIDNEQVVSYIINKSKEVGYVNVFPIGSITKGSKGEKLSEIGELKAAGVVAISDDGRPVESSIIMKNAMQYAKNFDITVISHCEDLHLAEGGVMNDGYWSTILGLKGIPSAAEEIGISRDIILSEYLDIPIHIAHVSSKRGVDLVRNAKKRGAKVTCETCPHYFTITDEMCKDYNTFAKVNPPLRTPRDVESIIEGIKDGTIDIIATDHAPHHIDEKNVEFDNAANGLVGFETAFSLAYTYLVKTGHITLMEIVEKMSYKPSNILKIDKGYIEVGANADIVIVDISDKFKIDIEKFESKSKNSPFNGFEVTAGVIYTIVGGKVIVKDKVI